MAPILTVQLCRPKPQLRTLREQDEQVVIVQNHWRALYEGCGGFYVMDSMLNKNVKADKHLLSRRFSAAVS